MLVEVTGLAVPILKSAKVPVPFSVTLSLPTMPLSVPVIVAAVVALYSLLEAVAPVTVSALVSTINDCCTEGAGS